MTINHAFAALFSNISDKCPDLFPCGSITAAAPSFRALGTVAAAGACLFAPEGKDEGSH
jgi:hypothetical protein